MSTPEAETHDLMRGRNTGSWNITLSTTMLLWWFFDCSYIWQLITVCSHRVVVLAVATLIYICGKARFTLVVAKYLGTQEQHCKDLVPYKAITTERQGSNFIFILPDSD